jgi:16S rRNA (cytosine967-C5)-methyltransferase
MQATQIGPQAVRLAHPCSVHLLPGFAEGDVSVQDAHAQLAARLLLGLHEQPAPDVQGWRVLDACAAPGGKTAHLLELADVRLLALDVDAERTHRVHDNLRRSTLQAQVVVADAGQPDTWWDGEAFDAVLLDAPCTASGIVRRHPDVRWLRRPPDLPQLAAVQARLLAALWPLVKPGGRLLYCTCSVFRIEGAQQIKTFLSRNTDARWQASPGHLLPGSVGPTEGLADNASRDGDGFFYALLHKTRA